MRWTNRDIEVIPRGNNFKALKLIDKYAKLSKDHPFITEAIRRYNLDGSYDSLQRIFTAIYNLVPFFPDPLTTQYIRTVNRSLKDQMGNCVDYSVFLSAFLRALGVRHKIRMVSTEPDKPGYNHVYIVLADGTPLDLVINQDQSGSESLKRERNAPAFGQEVPYIKKFDKKVYRV